MLPFAKHCLKHFTNINSFSSLNVLSSGHYLYLPLRLGFQSTERQRNVPKSQSQQVSEAGFKLSLFGSILLTPNHYSVSPKYLSDEPKKVIYFHHISQLQIYDIYLYFILI